MPTFISSPKEKIPNPYEMILNGLNSSDVWGPEMEKVVRIAAELASEYVAMQDLSTSREVDSVPVPLDTREFQVRVTEVFDWTPMAYPLKSNED